MTICDNALLEKNMHIWLATSPYWFTEIRTVVHNPHCWPNAFFLLATAFDDSNLFGKTKSPDFMVDLWLKSVVTLLVSFQT